jgi:hypothetical protein
MGMNTASVQRLYVAYFNRPADPVSLAVYEAMLPADRVATQAELAVIAETYFSPSAEYTTNFAGQSNSQIVNQLYQNIFGRAAEAEGLISWATKLTDGSMTVADLALQLSYSAQGTDLAVVSARIDAATAFTTALDTAGEITGYSGNEAAAQGRVYLAQISGELPTTDAAVTALKDAAVTGVDTSVASAVSAGDNAAGSTFTLTTGTDVATGTVGADVFNSVLQAAGVTGTTIQPGDSVTGGQGVDTLSIAVAGNAGAAFTVSAVSASGVEKLFASNFDTDATADGTVIDTTLMSGLTTVGLSASGANGDTKFTGMNNFVDAEMRNGSGDLKLTYGGAQAVSGTADVQNLAVSNVGAGTFTADGIETINLTSSTTKTTLAAVASDALSTLNVSGDAGLTVTATLNFAAGAVDGDATIDATLDASALTGALSVDIADANDIQATGGSGNDTFALGGTLSKFDIIGGGDGDDTVSITGHDGATVLKMSDLQLTSVETFKVTATNNKNININADSATPTNFVTVENATTAKTTDITNLAAGSAVTIENTVNGQATGVVTLGLKDPSGSSDALTINVNGTSGQGAETVDQIIVADVETINLSSGSVGVTPMVAGDSNVITDQSYSTATALNITGAANLTMTNAIVGTVLTTIDASAMTGNLALTAAAVVLDLKTGSGADTLTFGTTLTVDDVIDAGSNPSVLSVDSLSATINELGTSAAPGALQIANVETITLNTATAASFLDASKITGASTIQIENDQNVTISNLAAGTALMLGTDTAGALDEYTGTLNVSLADETGSADALTIALSKQGTDDDISATLKTAATLETLTIQASTDTATTNDVTLNVASVKSPTIALTKGDASEVVALGTLSTSTTTLDGSAFDGLMSATASAVGTSITAKTGAAANTITGGAGADTVTILNLGADDADGAGGLDVLNGTLLTSFTEATANFETVNYTVGNNIQTTVTGANGKGVDGATTFNLAGGDSLTTFAINYVSPGSLTKIDYSGYTGKSTASTFAASQLVNTMDVVGSAGTDTIVTTTANDNAAVKSMSGVETLKINVAGGATAFNFAVTSGVTKVQLDDDGTARIATLTDLAAGVAVEVEHGVTASGVVIDQVDKAAADNTQTVTIKTTATDTHTYSIDASDIETLTVKMSDASKIDLSSNAMTTAGATSTLLLTGNKAATLTLVNTDITTIDASGMTQGGSVTQDARLTAGAVTYTGSVGDDTLIMGNAGDTLTGGAGTDTLDINIDAILGGVNIDLTSATNQIVSVNASAPTGTVTGFENVDASGYIGPLGAQITGTSTGSTITGTAKDDSVLGGAGVDTITGGAGVDAINAAGGADVIVLGDSTNGNNYDQITGFTGGSDDIKALQSVHGWNSTANTTTVALQTGATLKAADAAGDGNILTISADIATHTYATFMAGTSTYAELEGTAITAMGLTGALDAAAIVLVVVDDGVDTGLWQLTSGDAANDNAVAASEIELIGILKGVTDATSLVAGDFVFT